MTTAPSAAERVPMKTKLAFGIGSSAETMVLYPITAYGLLFYNQVQGLEAHWAGLAFSVSLMLDGLVEPVVGSWSDRTKSRLGRRHPWMFAAPIPIALFFFALFNPPQGLDQLLLALWAGVAVSGLRQSMAFFHTPHLALGGELSPHYSERSKVMAYNSFFTWAGGSVLALVGLTFFFPETKEFRNGLLNPQPWPRFALVFGIAIATVLLASAWFTRDRIPFLPKPAADAKPFSFAAFFGDVAKALTNVNYLWLLAGFFFLSLMLGVRENMRLFVFSYYWQLSSGELRWLVLGSFLGYLTAFFVAPRLHVRFDKRPAIIWGAIGCSVIPAVPIVLGQLGVLSHDTPMLLPILIAFVALGYAPLSILSISVMSALADIADQNELTHGVRQEGILYSTRLLAAKWDQAIGGLLAGFIITGIGLSRKAKPGMVSEDTLFNLALWDGALAAIPGVIAALCYGQYRINRAGYEATRAALADRRAMAVPAQ